MIGRVRTSMTSPTKPRSIARRFALGLRRQLFADEHVLARDADGLAAEAH